MGRNSLVARFALVLLALVGLVACIWPPHAGAAIVFTQQVVVDAAGVPHVVEQPVFVPDTLATPFLAANGYGVGFGAPPLLLEQPVFVERDRRVIVERRGVFGRREVIRRGR